MKTRYTYKYPHTSWDGLSQQVVRNQRCWWYCIDRAIEWIEEDMQAGYADYPWMQLVEITDSGMRVVAECPEGGKCDVDPLVASGLKSAAE